MLINLVLHRRYTLGPHSPEYFSAAVDVGFIRRKSGKFAEALSVLLQVHEALKRDNQQQLKVYGDVIRGIGRTYTALRDYTPAANWNQQAVEWTRTTHGEKSIQYIHSLISLAQAEQYPNYAGIISAVGNLEHAARLSADLPATDPLTLATILNNLGTCYRDLYRLDDAITALSNAAAIWEASPQPPTGNLGLCLSSLGEAMFRAGDVDKAMEILERGQQVFATAENQNTFEYARFLQARGNIACDLGNYVEAVEFGKEAIDVMRKVRGLGHPDLSQCLQNLGAYYLKLGRYKDALELFEEAIGAVPPKIMNRNRGAALSLQNVAIIYGRQKRFDEARQCLEAALELNIEMYGAKHPQVADCLNALGAHDHTQGDLEEAANQYRKSLAMIARPDLPETPKKALVLENLGRIALEQGDFSSARTQLQKALQIYTDQLGEQHADRASVLHDLARLAAAEGTDDTATNHFAEAFLLAVRKVKETTKMQSARQQIWHQNQMRIHFFAALTHALNDSERHSDALQMIWAWKQTVSQRQAAYRRLSRDSDIQPLVAGIADTSTTISAMLQTSPLLPEAGAPESAYRAWTQQQAQWKEDLRDLNRQQEQLERQIAEVAEEKGIQLSVPTLTAVQQALPTDTAMVEFVKYVHVAAPGERNPRAAPDVRYAACVVRADRDPVLLDLGSSEQLEGQIVAFRKAFTSETPSANDLRVSEVASAWLRDNFWQPIERHLENVERVMLCPDGAVGILPFAALPARDSGGYLIEDYRLATVPSVATFLQTESATDRPRISSVLLVGDVAYGNAPAQVSGRAPLFPMEPVEALPGTAKELAAIRQSANNSRRQWKVSEVTGTQATEDRILNSAPSHQLLHIATHGFFAEAETEFVSAPSGGDSKQNQLQNPVDPLLSNLMPGYLSGLKLAGVNSKSLADGGSYEGILHSAEIEATDLQNVDTVVLSACQTALGQSVGGEGLIGLQRAFHIAGVDTVIASLWNVNDEATAALMTSFYRNLIEAGMSTQDALRHAQLEMLRQQRTRGNGASRGLKPQPGKVRPTKPAVKPDGVRLRPSAVYWAGFQLSGS